MTLKKMFAIGFLAFAPFLVFSQDDGESSALKKKVVTLEKLAPYAGSFRYRGFEWDKLAQEVKSDPMMKATYEKMLEAAKKTAA
ncbi:MAG: hypothetical protein JNM63_04375, partial [Spirochaetia bacterium]|nr:hypothetical protein [Spirochaetia bacterium]